MAVPYQRDPDLIAIIDSMRSRLDDLNKTVISRWGRTSHLTADPTTPADGQTWIRSDNRRLVWRANAQNVNPPAQYTGTAAQRIALTGMQPGDLWHETDGFRTMEYQSATTGWALPWGIPWGKAAYTETTTAVATIVAQTFYGGLATTWTATANRRYKVTCQMEILQTVANDVWVGNLIDQNVPANLNRFTGSFANTASATVIFTWVSNVTRSGAQDFRLTLLRAAGTGSLTMSGASTAAFLLIEDIGPLANPT